MTQSIQDIQLCLIQGDYIARYLGKEQKEVYNLQWSSPEIQNNLLAVVEQVRTNS
jgi:hypothetical protein